MYAQENKSNEKNNRLVINSVAQKKNSRESIFQFGDNRPKVIEQRRIQSIISDCQYLNAPIQLMKEWAIGSGFKDIQIVPDEAENKKKWLRCKYKGEETYISCVDIGAFSQEDWSHIEYYDDEVASDQSVVSSDTDDQVKEDDFALLTVKQIFPNESTYFEKNVNAWNIENFSEMGVQNKLESITLRRPSPLGTHYEILAVVGGVSIKIDLTESGYRLIYNADQNYSAGYFQKSEPKPVQNMVGKDLYDALISIARENGKYNIETNDCQRFAEDLFNKITKSVVEDSL